MWKLPELRGRFRCQLRALAGSYGGAICGHEPNARLLRRMSILLCVSVGHLLGETIETDPVLTASTATWHSWVDNTTGLDARTAVAIRTEWIDRKSTRLNSSH